MGYTARSRAELGMPAGAPAHLKKKKKKNTPSTSIILNIAQSNT